MKTIPIGLSYVFVFWMLQSLAVFEVLRIWITNLVN